MPSDGLFHVWAVSMGAKRYVCHSFFKGWSLIWRASWVLCLVVVAGCAAYTPPALTTSHPAHPEAGAGLMLPRSTTLSYKSSDLPSMRSTAAAASETKGASSSGRKDGQAVVGEGKVIAVVPASSEIVLTHGEIKGFMDAMTMGYQIQPPSLLEGVQAGDTVRFTIDTEQKAIVTLEKLPQ